jgi:oligopeptide/dipeptide ABC transporter ATP-binding protein
MKEDHPLLQVEHIKKYYPVRGGIISHTIAQVKAVEDMTFEIKKGTTLGLVGESGCGKSTMGKLIAGLEKPDEGRILFDGVDLTDLSEKERKPYRLRMQMIFQDSFSSLNPRKRVEDILLEPMLFHKIASKENADVQVLRLLDMVGLSSDSLGRFPYEFSGGQRQRICIARALSLNPDFIVCDEPVSALDVSIQAQILNLLLDLQKQLGLTLLFIGHGLGAVNYISDRIAVMYLGRLVEIADASELFRHPAHPYTQALCDAAPNPDPCIRDRKKTEILQGEAEIHQQPKEEESIGCLFAPRCPYRRESCLSICPELLPVPGTEPGSHLSACPYVFGQKGEH